MDYVIATRIRYPGQGPAPMCPECRDVPMVWAMDGEWHCPECHSCAYNVDDEPGSPWWCPICGETMGVPITIEDEIERTNGHLFHETCMSELEKI